MAKTKTVFECQACGNQQSKWVGKCPHCGAWDSFLELNAQQIETLKEISKSTAKPSLAKQISEVEIEKITRISTQNSELDLVLGGGVVEGSLVLIGGSPGIGKSTLLLKIASNFAAQSKKTLYASGEESASQIKMRAQRLDAVKDGLFLLTEILLENILAEVRKNEYKILVIDSIQTLYSEKIASANENICVFIIGHITKDGSIAGPRILEHMVDVVLYFEGDSSRELRMLRGFKNRFGSTSEVGIFEMSQNGLISANDVAGKFFTRGKATSGSAITITMEGSRALSVEIQALVCESAYPKRSSTGFDKNRLDMLLALPLGHYDVFINVSGGVKISETAADLAVVAAIISSFKNRPISKESVFMGELSLNGEIREIFNLDQRLKEAKTQKFKNAIVPSKPLDAQGLKCFVAGDITQVLEWM